MTKIIDLEFRNELSERLFMFSVDVIDFMRTIPDSTETRIIKNQLIKAATSSAANYEESQAGVSKREFSMKVGISLKEMRETSYWLRIVLMTKLSEDKQLYYLIKEAKELRLILGSIVTKVHKERLEADKKHLLESCILNLPFICASRSYN